MTKRGARKVNQEIASRINRKIVLSFIKKAGVTTRSSIVSHTQLSASTVTYIINEFKKQQLIKEISSKGNSNGTAGNKPLLLELDVKHNYFIGIELKLNEFIIVGLNLKDEIFYKKEVKFKFKNFQAIETHLLKIIKGTIQDINRKKLLGISICMSGVIDPYKQSIIFSNMYNIKDFTFNNSLRKEWKVPVIIENNANAAALGEYYLKYRDKVSNLLYIYFQGDHKQKDINSIGIGVGTIIKGEIFHGETCTAGEINDLIFRTDEFGFALEKGENGTEDFYKKLGKRIGLIISILVNGLNPGLIVLGGEYLMEDENFFNIIKKYIEKDILDFIEVEIKKTSFKDAGAIGSAAIASHNFFSYKDII